MGQLGQIRRMIKLRHYLNSDPPPDAEHITRLLRISRRTLFRDLQLLRTADRRFNALAEIIEQGAEFAAGDLTPREAACLLAVFRHEVRPRAGSPHARVWERVRKRFVAVIEDQTRHCKGQVEQHLKAMLRAGRPLRGTGSKTIAPPRTAPPKTATGLGPRRPGGARRASRHRVLVAHGP